jgi:hypothetical protein
VGLSALALVVEKQQKAQGWVEIHQRGTAPHSAD